MTLPIWFQDQQKKLILTVILILISVIVGGFLLFPDFFYDQFIWKYFWGPIVSDGLDKPVSYHGVEAAAKFTLVSEIVYGIMVAGALYGIYHILKKWDITIDFTFFLGTLPFIFYGSIARVLEDAHFFSAPIVFLFVTPLIYFQTLLLAICALLVGIYLCRIKKITQIPSPYIMGIIGIILTLPLVYYVGLWMTGSTWSSSNETFPFVFLLVIFLTFSITAIVFVIARFSRSQWKKAAIFITPLNLAMIFGHQLDGIASYISIYDPFNMGLPTYIEKHPASDILLQIWPPLFPIVKFILIIIIIYLFDEVYRKELIEQKQLVNLLKIGIFMLGFAPGFRDLLRVAMGV
mgnify:CR=1 FL=1